MKSQLKTFKKNLALLERINPKLKYQLSTSDPSALEFCQTQQGELNLKRHYQGQNYYYHCNNQAQQEANDWFHHLSLIGVSVIYVYGIGLGYYYQAAKSWLKKDKNHALVFLEEDLAVLYCLFQTEQGTAMLKDPQVDIVYFTDVLTDKTLFNELSWKYILCPFVVSSLKLYEAVNKKGFLELHHHISHQLMQKKVLVDEYLQYGIVFFRNFYPNLFELPQAYLGNGLFNQFKQVPAIICGAGPSLKKNIEVLKQLTHQALIFAGGSSLNALTAKGVMPHFGAGIDPNQGQYERIMQTQQYPVPFFYRNRLFHAALKAVSGPRLYLTGSGGYEIAAWFEEQLGLPEEEPLDEGHNVVNFCLEIAHALGCNPLILVGVDLAFTDQQIYAEGVVSQTSLNPDDSEADFDAQPLLKEDIHGKPVYTLWKWITEAEWMDEFARTHPEVTVINATEGGLGFANIPNQTLQEVAKTHLKEQSDLSKRIEEEIYKHSLSFINQEQVASLMQTLQESLERCVGFFSELLEEMKELKNKIKKKEPIPDSLQTPRATLIEMEIDEELGYQSLLDTFNTIYIRLHHRQIQNLQQPRLRLAAKTRNLRKIELNVQRLSFLRNVAQVNLELIHRALNSFNGSTTEVTEDTERGRDRE